MKYDGWQRRYLWLFGCGKIAPQEPKMAALNCWCHLNMGKWFVPFVSYDDEWWAITCF